MSDKGYQIVEPEILEEWLGANRNQEFLVALLYWIAKNLQLDFGARFPGVIIEVIKVEYLGAYPAIGIHYPNDQIPDLAASINLATNHLLSDKTVIDFAKYLFAENTKWGEVTSHLFE